MLKLSLLLYCAAFCLFGTSCGISESASSFSFADSSGNRYGGTTITKNGEIIHKQTYGSPPGSSPQRGGSNVPNKDNTRPNTDSPEISNEGTPNTDYSESNDSENDYNENLNTGPNSGANEFFGGPNAFGGYGNYGGNGGSFGFNYALNSFSSANDDHGHDDFMRNFVPLFFGNLEKTLQDIFDTDFENQERAFLASQRAFVMSGFPHFMPMRPFRPFHMRPFKPLRPMTMDFDDFPKRMAHNSAAALAVSAPGYKHQIAAISPENPETKISTSKDTAVVSPAKLSAHTGLQPNWFKLHQQYANTYSSAHDSSKDASKDLIAASTNYPGYFGYQPNWFQFQNQFINPSAQMNPNVNIKKFKEPSNRSGGNFHSVSASSHSSSMNVNGQQISSKSAKTVVNDNGEITEYEVSD